jgi:hypothetical protein
MLQLKRTFQIDLLPNREERKAHRNADRHFEKSVKRNQPGTCRPRHKHYDHESDTGVTKRAPLEPKRNA